MDLSSELQNVSQPAVAEQGPRMGAAQLFLTFLALQEKFSRIKWEAVAKLWAKQSRFVAPP